MEAINGTQKQITFGRTDVCSTCKGTRSKPGTSETKCGSCGGAGFQSIRQGPFMIQQVCGSCEGAGSIIKNPCTGCRGRGITHQEVRESVNIPKGVDNGVNLRVSKKGNAGMGGPAGDLMIQVKVKPHPYFKRDGSDILTDLYLSLGDAVLGQEVKVKTLYGTIRMKVDAGTQHNEKKKIANYGVQKLPPNHHQKGNHYVTIKVVIPRTLSPEQRQAMELFRSVEEKPANENI
uniref:CR-type domain-containing protein n=1 Tax=Strombidium rassoulzadegani TaxID=1082188 RepID=A0A7S3CJZ9_9SPIT|mmetsp:Transcript_13385/g.22789  ORF Transcript_13385/g.22789 Transcript_13385/m.22789 type:complete len:233 (+) Transcript_13385:802-1500(+)